jgi:hypothetical protein
MPNPPLTPGQKADLGFEDWITYGWVNGGEFLVNEHAAGNPTPNFNAYLAQWRQYFGPANMTQIEARLVYEWQFGYLEDENIIQSDYDPEYTDSVGAIEGLAEYLDTHDNDFSDLPIPT